MRYEMTEGWEEVALTRVTMESFLMPGGAMLSGFARCLGRQTRAPSRGLANLA